MHKNSLVFSSILLMVLAILVQITAFLREAFFASSYGTSIQSDDYFMALTIPNVMFSVVAVSINTTILPIYTQKLTADSQEEADNFMSNIMTQLLLISGLFTIVGMIFTPVIVRFFVPGFSAEAYLLTIQVTRILFSTVIFTTVYSLFSIVLNARRIFGQPNIAAIFPNIFVITGIIVANGRGVEYIAYFTLLGYVTQTLYLLFFMKGRFTYIPQFHINDDIKKIGALILPVIISISVAEVNNIVDKILASGLNAGSISAVNYSQKICNIFTGIVLMAISTVTYPVFSELTATKREDELTCFFNKTINIVIIIFAPIIILAFLFRVEIVTIVFGRGIFGKSSIYITAYVLGFSVFRIMFIALREIQSRLFFSLGNTKIPMFNSAIGVSLNIILNLILIKPMGVGGLALATTIAAAAISFLMFYNLKKHLKGFSFHVLNRNLIKTATASIVMIGMYTLLKGVMMNMNIINVLLVSSISTIAYFLCHQVLRTNEVCEYTAKLWKYRTRKNDREISSSE